MTDELVIQISDLHVGSCFAESTGRRKSEEKRLCPGPTADRFWTFTTGRPEGDRSEADMRNVGFCYRVDVCDSPSRNSGWGWAPRTQVQGELMITVLIGALREMGHRELFLCEAEKIPWNTPPNLGSFEGPLRIRTSGRISGTTLRSGSNQFATLPVTPLEVNP